MPAKKSPPKDQKPQKERFIEAAKETGVDLEQFERAMGKIIPPKTPKKKPS